MSVQNPAEEAFFQKRRHDNGINYGPEPLNVGACGEVSGIIKRISQFSQNIL